MELWSNKKHSVDRTSTELSWVPRSSGFTLNANNLDSSLVRKAEWDI